MNLFDVAVASKLSGGGGGGGSSDFDVKTLTIVNGEVGDIVFVPSLPLFENMTVYDIDSNPVALGDTLCANSNNNITIEEGESATVHVLTYKGKAMSYSLLSDFDVSSAVGCTVERYTTSDDIVVTLITFTQDSASITIAWAH